MNRLQAISPSPAKSTTLTSFKPAISKIKPVFRTKLTVRCSIPSNLAYITKSRPKMISTIELINLQSTFKTVRTICKALKSTKKASSLIIGKDKSNSQNLKQLKNLLNSIHRHWKKLSIPYITSSEQEFPLFQEVVEIATRLRRYRDLSNLDVGVCCHQQVLKNHLLSHLLQQLKGLKNLKTLHLDLSGNKNRGEPPEDYEPNALIFTSKFPRSLEKLSLHLEETNFPNQKMLSTFAANLSRCNSLTDLNFRCGFNFSRPFDVKILAPLFEQVNTLKSFKINQFFPPHLQPQDSINLVKSLESLRHLTKLDLFIFFAPEDSSILFSKNLFKYLGLLTNLKCLKLSLSVRKLSENDNYLDEQNIFLPLQSLINLHTLDFTLFCDKEKELPGFQSLSQAIQSLHCLKDFELFFLHQKVHRSHLISLSQMFKKISSLQTLILIFADADLESLETLYKGISHLTLSLFYLNIRYKNLDFPRQQKNPVIWRHEKGLTPLFSTIGNFKSLFALSLNLSVFDVLTKEMTSLSLELEKMKQLGCLILQLPQSSPAQKFKGLRNLMATIKEKRDLRYLQLIFKGDKLCDEEIEIVASNLAECSRSLERLDLNFNETKDLKDKSLFALKNALQTLSSLRDLILIFGPKNIFTGEAVHKLFETLSFLKNLETLTIKLPSEAVPLDSADILKRFAGHWNLNAFTVNEESWLKSVDQDQD